MKRSLSRVLVAPALLLASMLLLSGCFAVETSYVVNEDGSGSQTLRLAIPAEVASSFGDELPSIEELEQEPEMEPLREALGDDGSITFFSSVEEGIGFELTIEVEASDNFGAALAAKADQLSAAMPPDESDDMGNLIDMAVPPTIVRDGDEWTFELAGDAVDPAMLAGMTGDEDAAGFASMFLGQTTITTRVKLPGEVVEHNADEVLDDGTLVWSQTGAAEPRTLMARSDLSGGGLSTMAMAGLLIGGIALIAAIAGFVLFGRRRKPA